jgi:hypothetical protein
MIYKVCQVKIVVPAILLTLVFWSSQSLASNIEDAARARMEEVAEKMKAELKKSVEPRIFYAEVTRTAKERLAAGLEEDPLIKSLRLTKKEKKDLIEKTLKDVEGDLQTLVEATRKKTEVIFQEEIDRFAKQCLQRLEPVLGESAEKAEGVVSKTIEFHVKSLIQIAALTALVEQENGIKKMLGKGGNIELLINAPLAPPQNLGDAIKDLFSRQIKESMSTNGRMIRGHLQKLLIAFQSIRKEVNNKRGTTIYYTSKAKTVLYRLGEIRLNLNQYLQSGGDHIAPPQQALIRESITRLDIHIVDLEKLIKGSQIKDFVAMLADLRRGLPRTQPPAAIVPPQTPPTPPPATSSISMPPVDDPAAPHNQKTMMLKAYRDKHLRILNGKEYYTGNLRFEMVQQHAIERGAQAIIWRNAHLVTDANGRPLYINIPVIKGDNSQETLTVDLTREFFKQDEPQDNNRSGQSR